jgi:hypothetical protein
MCSTVKSGKSIVGDRGKKQNICKREKINFHLRSGYYVTVVTNRTYIGPSFVFGIKRFSIYTGIINKYFLHYDFI